MEETRRSRLHAGPGAQLQFAREVADAAHAYAAALAAGREKPNDASWAAFRPPISTRRTCPIRSGHPDLRRDANQQLPASAAAYAEFVFSGAVLWPDFTKADLAAAIARFCAAERRYGLTGEQIAKAGSVQLMTKRILSFIVLWGLFGALIWYGRSDGGRHPGRPSCRSSRCGSST